MLHWICPECGNECEPSDRDCPSCYPPDPSTARQWKAATIAAPPPLPIAPSVVVREPAAIPAFLLPVEEPGSDAIRTLKLPIPVLAPPSPPIPRVASLPAQPAPPSKPVEAPPAPVPAGLAALSHNMQIRENASHRSLSLAATPEPFPTPVWNHTAASLATQYSRTEPALETASRVRHPQPQGFVAAPPPAPSLSVLNCDMASLAPVAPAVATPNLWLQIVPDEIQLPDPEPEAPVEQDPAMAGSAYWRPSKPAFIALPQHTGVAKAIQLTCAPWVSALRIPFHDASPEWDADWIEQTRIINQLDRVAQAGLAPLVRLHVALEARRPNRSEVWNRTGCIPWPFEGPRPSLRSAPYVKIETDPMVLDAAERTAVRAVEQFDAAASQLAGLVRLPVRLQFRKGFTATGFWLNREPEPWTPLPPQGAPVIDYRVPMDRAVLAAIEEERRKAMELVAPPSLAAKPTAANNALVLVSNPGSDRKVDPNGTIEILHPIIEAPVPAMAKLQPLPLFGLRPKQSNPRPRHVPLKPEFPPGLPFIPMRSVANVRIIASPIYGEKRPRTYKPAKAASMPSLGTGSFRQPATTAGWMVTAGVALLIPITAIGVVNYWILPSQRASAASNPPVVETAARPAPAEPAAGSSAGGGGSSAATAAGANAFNWRKSLQLTGIRMLEGGRVQFLVVNIGKADVPPSSVFQVTLRSNNPKPGEPPIGSFQVRLNAPLSPREARDLITPITLSSQLRPDVDLNDLRIEMQPVSSPVAIRR